MAATSDSQFSEYTLGQGLELLHELQIYQIELELQNHALHESCEELKRLQTHYRSLFYGAPVAYLQCDQSGQIVDCNDRAEQLVGRTLDAMRGRRLGAFLSSAMADRLHVIERSGKGARSAIRQGQLTLTAADGLSREVLVEIRDLPAVDREEHMKLFALVDLTPHSVVPIE
ncbi:PAS domain S-box protein [Motiliproteus sediminis]|uniref:PAS domain S-box protein n=1 Tax=Motiliproteus sediminis TaxID=1468178 RepID=UPI001AEF4DF2|nr:PAS domain-containing protein [Motiliproteus sediminis]